ncbi:MAG: O-acetyl-ADP-ribose deacetylase [Desulfobacterales bacterium]|jgi:O-acetyl-ADP-ribose deacetylase (regulator of RNase III)
MTISPIDRIRVIQDDITRVAVDAIVNAANSSLRGGGGVDGAIHRAAGPDLLAECRSLGGCPTGEARLTGGYRLPARHVIHTVGPVYRGLPGDRSLLWNCYRNCFALAAGHRIKSIAFPAISCGVYGYPIADACKIAVSATLRCLEGTAGSIETVLFVLFSENDRQVYDLEISRYR